MTVSSENNRNTYSGNGVTTVFAYTFKILDDDEISVQWKVTSTGVITTKTKTTHYTVSGVDAAAGGNVTFTAGNEPPSTVTVILLRDMAFTQQTDYNEYDAFPAETHEEALDRLTMMIQQLQEAFDRTFFFDAATAESVTFDYTIPDPTGYAGYALSVSSDEESFSYTAQVDLEGFTMPAGTGLLVKDGISSATTRTLTGTAAEVTVTNGDGQSGAPTFSLPTALTFTSKTITGGTYASPTISGTMAGNFTLSGALVLSGSLANTSLRVLDTDASHALVIKPGSNLTAERILTLTTGDVARTLTLGGDVTLTSGTHSGTNTGDQTLSVIETIFNASGTYTPTAGMDRCLIEVQGGGGGGGGSPSGVTQSAGGGGGGGFASRVFTSAQVGASATITIGAAGAAGANTGATGGSGGTSSAALVGSGTITISATGGSGGTNGTATATGGAGGTGTNGTTNITGQTGGGGVANSSVFTMGGGGGNSIKGHGGGEVVTTTSIAGAAGVGYGGGGSGGCDINSSGAQAGGAGTVGVVIVTEYILS